MDEYSRIAIMADAETLVGFRIAGMASDSNMVEISRDLKEKDIVAEFNKLIIKKEVAIIFICDFISERIQQSLDEYKSALPSILVIPSKNR